MDLSVTIKSLKGTQMAAKITGTFTVSQKYSRLPQLPLEGSAATTSGQR
ncbi:hypothetical protein [Candidatus Nitrosotenuis sp. DW1]|nr:hypothetical protein [Candidatus Nitrosotenuis sp. DW1]